MIAWIENIDKVLFLVLNRGAANPVFDAVMPYITDSDHWIIPIILIWLYLMIFCGKKGRIFGVVIIILIVFSNGLSDIIKHLIHRYRPCHPNFFIDGGNFLIDKKKSFSFPSSHAANMGAMATYFSARYPKTRWIVIPIALIIGYSRIYVGVHYLTDVLAGFLQGMFCCWLILKIKCEKWVDRAWQAIKARPNQKKRSPKDQFSDETET